MCWNLVGVTEIEKLRPINDLIVESPSPNSPQCTPLLEGSSNGGATIPDDGNASMNVAIYPAWHTVAPTASIFIASPVKLFTANFRWKAVNATKTRTQIIFTSRLEDFRVARFDGATLSIHAPLPAGMLNCRQPPSRKVAGRAGNGDVKRDYADHCRRVNGE